MNEQQSGLYPVKEQQLLRKLQKIHTGPIEVGVRDLSSPDKPKQSESFRMAMEISMRIKQQTQNNIRDKILSVQKQVMDQTANNKKNVVSREVVNVVEKQVKHQENVAKYFKERISGQNSPQNYKKLERLNDSFNNRALNETFKSKTMKLQNSIKNFDQNSSNRNGVGVQQVPVTDEIEPGHVPIDEIKNIEMQSGYQRPPSKRQNQNNQIQIQNQQIQRILDSKSSKEDPEPYQTQIDLQMTDDQDIKKRVNMLNDMSVNMNTDEDNHTVDGARDTGPKIGRGMGFPNMKYLDPDAHGMPIQEKTLYKEFQQNKDNDVKLQREGFINARKDIANSTFIKLFQASENPDKREELQSVQYAEQSVDDDTSANEDTKIIINKSTKYLKKSKSKSKEKIGFQQQQYLPPLNNRPDQMSFNNSQAKINAVINASRMINDPNTQQISLPSFQAPQGMTQVPIMFSGSIPSLQYQDSTQGLNFTSQHLSPAQQFLNQQLSRINIQDKSNTMLPPIQSSSRIKNEANHRFNAIEQRSPQQVSFKISAESNEFQDRNPSPVKQRPQRNYMPSNDIINLELMHNFGGRELTENQKTNPFESKLLESKLEKQSILSTGSPERIIPFDSKEDKLMRQILDGYSDIMNTGQSTKENLFLKKIRFHHPIFKDLNFNAFKMIFDLCEVVQIKKGQMLYKQDHPIADIYFVMHGRLSLRYFQNKLVEDFDEAGYLGQSLGEEILFYEEKTYRETAVCTSARCCILQIKSEYLFELGDESFMNRGLNSEAMKADMDLMFERLSHIYNVKERWRISIAAKMASQNKNETNYTQFIKSQ